jgi:2',3'-cyclic-nucleotide 2'-phosphodiesterase (5'-nucleotidase family)
VKLLILVLASIALSSAFLDAQIIRRKVPISSFETVTIIYTANTRGLHGATQTDTPASALQTIITAIRKENKDTLLVDLGNFMGATATTILTQGKLDFQVMELLGYDLLHVSTDEFVGGSENLNSRIRYTKIPVLAGNLNIAGSTALKWTILSCGNRKVGFIGLTSPNFNNLVIANMRKDVAIESATSYITKAIEEMTGKADIVVALTDLADNEIAQIRDIPGLDLIITTGGDAIRPGSDWISVGFPGEKRAAVARVLSSGTAVHLLELHGFADENKWTVDEIVGDVYGVTKNTPRENAVDNWFQWQVDTYVQINNGVLGELKEPLSNEDGRTKQTPLGNAVTDLMRNLSKSHLAILNSGALRSGLPKGPITEWDLIEAVPYPNELVVERMKGAQIEAVIGRSRGKSGQSGYLQISGLTAEPASLGDRISGLAIQPERWYTVITLDFLSQGGEGYDELKGAKIIQRYPISLRELCREAFQKYGSLVVAGLPMDKEANFWSVKFHIDTSLNAFIANPSNLLLYPDEVTLVGQQLISGSLASRFDISRVDFFTGFQTYIEAQYGLTWDRNWVPTETVDTIEAGTQVSLNLSNLLFGGVKTLDPYVSAVMDTILLYPDPANLLLDPNLPRPGSVKLAGGVELTLLKLISLKVGIRWQDEPFNASLAAVTGVEGILAFKWDIFKDILSFDTTTDLFTAFNITDQGITLSSVNHIFFALNDTIKIGPRFQLFYNTLVGHVGYLFDVSLILNFNL